MTRPGIGVVFLDIGGVLLDFDHAIAWRRLAAQAGAAVEEVQEFLVDTGLARSFDVGAVDSRAFFTAARDRFRLSLDEGAFRRLWADIFTPKPDVWEVIPELSSILPLYILSNTDPIHFEHIERTYPFIERFTGRVLSYETGFRKPEEGIYRAALALVGRGPGECLFFDDLAPNVEAARRLGIQAHLFTDLQGMKKHLHDHGLLLKKT